ncbi:hypothetical protein Ancab_021155, partial [Ancistrocladus abbreviatus]
MRDDEASSSKKNLSPSLRRFTRETSSKKETSPSPSNARRSERLVKPTPTKSPAEKRAEKVEKDGPLKIDGGADFQFLYTSTDLYLQGLFILAHDPVPDVRKLAVQIRRWLRLPFAGLASI